MLWISTNSCKKISEKYKLFDESIWLYKKNKFNRYTEKIHLLKKKGLKILIISVILLKIFVMEEG
jgi:hypothetical protein